VHKPLQGRENDRQYNKYEKKEKTDEININKPGKEADHHHTTKKAYSMTINGWLFVIVNIRSSVIGI